MAKPSELPIISKAEIAKHNSLERGVWVSFGGAVYDITSFIANHPGGVEKILTAAGGALEPYWSLYRQHLEPSAKGGDPVPKSHVREFLEPLQIGWLDPAEAAAAKAARPSDDPYVDEPERHAALIMISETPCSAEVPPALITDSWCTPNALWFVRNHHPVPKLDEEAFELEVCGKGVESRRFSIDQLKALPKTEVTATLQCGGNRRGALNEVRKTSGNAWGIGAVSTAKWGGVLLREVLQASGLSSARQAGVEHVQFEGVDGTCASIPAEKAMSEYGDVLLAYEMNGDPLPPDHGYPLRAVVPGYVGVRNIKWINKVVVSEREADGVWQRGIAYKVFNPSVTAVTAEDIEAHAPVQEMPVQSVITSPLPGTPVEEGEEIPISGFAWSGGGRGIVRVDVSADGGATWRGAKLLEGSEQPRSQAWAWTFWEAEVPAPSSAAKEVELVCKAVDASHNSQPELSSSVWNLRGLANNSWHRVSVPVAASESDAE